MNVGTIWSWLLFLSKKLLSGAISPDDFNTALTVVNLEFWQLKLGLNQEYKQGVPLARQGYEVSKKQTEDTMLFRKTVQLLPGPGGLFVQPEDYAYTSTMYYQRILPDGTPQNQEFEWMTDDQFNESLNSRLMEPTYKDPIIRYTQINGNQGWQVVPAMQNLQLTYLRYPETPVFGYTIDPETDDVVYNSAASTQPEWTQLVMPDFAVAIGKYWGINLRDPELYSSLKTRQTEGM